MESPDDVMEQSTQTEDVNKSYAANQPRISKDDLFMIIALWMQDFVTHEEAKIDDYHQVGAVLASADDRIYAADCSREGVHAVARLLIKHPEKAKGSKIFMSRKPCPICAKLIVQSKVERVFYLPFRPENYSSARNNRNKLDKVDELFKSSLVAASLFIYEIERNVLEHVREKPNKQLPEFDVSNTVKLLSDQWKLDIWESDWFTKIKDDLPWPAFDDKISNKVKEGFQYAIEWMARVMVATGRSSREDIRYSPLLPSNETPQISCFDPTSDRSQQKKANHLMNLASFLTQRTDDPKTGVGAVIVNSKLEILGFGWNGFPQKARYGAFGRGSSSDRGVMSKLPYVLHAEQNALLMRNCHNVKDSTLFVTKPPCNECTPLLAMEGVRTVVVNEVKKKEVKEEDKKDVEEEDKKDVEEEDEEEKLEYDMFPNKIMKKEFVCFEAVKKETLNDSVHLNRFISVKICVIS